MTLACYRQRITEVTAEVAPKRLLVFDVAEGWIPLCGFLGAPLLPALDALFNATEPS